MSKVKGKVARIGDGKFSKYIMLEERDGFYFNTKFNPKCGVGDVVGITFTPKGDTRGNISDVKILEDAGGPKGVQEDAAPAGRGKSYSDDRPSIVWQHSQEMALLLVTLLVSSESIKLPKAADREDFIAGFVDDYTVRFNAEALTAKLAGDETEAPTTAEDFDDKPTDEWAADDEWAD
jgi:hypothetical protein